MAKKTLTKSSGSMSLKKHRKAFGKSNRNQTNNIQVSRELELEQKKIREMKEKQKPKMYNDVASLFGNR